VKWYHLLHAAGWIVVAFGGAYMFFTEPGMDWRIDAITAIFMVPLVGIAILLYKIMFRKKSAQPFRTADRSTTSPVDPGQQARNNPR
jgi:hypothetical protein